MRKTRLTLGLAAVAGFAAFAGPAQAADQVITGTVANTVGVVAPPTAAITGIGPGATGTGSTTVTLTSTDALTPHTLSIADTSTTAGHIAGRMDRLVGTGPVRLANPLAWSTAANGVFANLLTTPAAVGAPLSGLVATRDVFFSQPANANEALLLGDTYTITVTYTAS